MSKNQRVNPDIRFFDKVKITDSCWEWTAAKTKKGYGSFWPNKNFIQAHRYSYEYFKGKIPKSLFVLHSCDNPPCVNPDHLFLGTQKDNVKDAIIKNRHKGNLNSPFKKGENHINVKLNKIIINKIRDLYLTDKYSQKDLSTLFSINLRTIYDIVNYRTWRD